MSSKGVVIDGELINIETIQDLIKPEVCNKSLIKVNKDGFSVLLVYEKDGYLYNITIDSEKSEIMENENE